jgi:addiction module RelE/StbE family toxin
MAKQIRWSRESSNDLESIFQFIARDSEEYARRAVDRIMDATEPLLDFPKMGRQVPEFDDPAIRDIIVYSYRVIYRVEADGVTIVGIIHGARELRNALTGRKV